MEWSLWRQRVQRRVAGAALQRAQVAHKVVELEDVEQTVDRGDVIPAERGACLRLGRLHPKEAQRGMQLAHVHEAAAVAVEGVEGVLDVRRD